MPSPFPGMDPFMESEHLWPTFHRLFITGAEKAIQHSLGATYQTVIRDRIYQLDGEQREPYLEIRLQANDQLVTLLDLVSPANKTRTEARAAYLETRRQARTANANLVEMDFILQGQPMLE